MFGINQRDRREMGRMFRNYYNNTGKCWQCLQVAES